MLPRLLNDFKCMSFDNLALEQLDVKSVIPKDAYDEMFMGNDGEGTMYIDLVSKEFAVSSTSKIRYPIQSKITSMFNRIKVKNTQL